jgi:outer membrane protein OmpA-like peptidoglycan-associated protein
VTPDDPFDFFLDIGGGMQFVDVHRGSNSDQPGRDDLQLYRNPSSDFMLHGGPGLIIQLGGPVHLRADARWVGTVGGDPTKVTSDIFSDFEWTLGLDFRPEIPPDKDGDGIRNKDDQCPDDPEDFDDFEDDDGCPDLDNDKDGIEDEHDDCRDRPEDRDGFEDDDGCPDPDNDGDGIKDRKDRCPDEAEDKDGFEDDDGCPDPDNDRDGVKDRKDHCPDDPEDKDGFEDTDGCPDPDNDQDGIKDVRDDCPDDPETMNGFDDRDGCPDDVPVEIKRFTGVIEGITFETGKTTIRPGSAPTLYAALDVLEKYPELAIEIQGHTDDVGNDEANLRLSQGRAEAVMAWFVAAGISPERLRAVGYGETRPIAENSTDAGRAQNRRVEFHPIGMGEPGVPE